jgi:hypothetical protein
MQLGEGVYIIAQGRKKGGTVKQKDERRKIRIEQKVERKKVKYTYAPMQRGDIKAKRPRIK